MGALTTDHLQALSRLMDDLVPGDGPTPGAGAAGGVDYVEMLLSAFDHDPPRIWAGGPFSGRHGGTAGFGDFLELSPWEALAWRTRIEGSHAGPAAHEPAPPAPAGHEPVPGWRHQYAEGLGALGDDYGDLDGPTREQRRAAAGAGFVDLVFTHACEALYGDPVYGANRDLAAWAAIDYQGDSQPTGYTDAEVSAPGAVG